jgi:tRNA(Ile)-lysidine synthase
MNSVKLRNESLNERFKNTLSAIIANQPKELAQHGIAVAYSGGLDSAVLLMLTAQFCRDNDLSLFAFHVHHGLSVNADSWLLHCELLCKQNDIQFFSARVDVDRDSKEGIEAAARLQRYRALGDMCMSHQVSLILTAHHQDDQAETLLLQLLRGSGLSGLSGMDAFNRAPGLFGTSDVLMVRPFLGQTKQTLLNHAVEHHISYVEDESNSDHRYARNALRHQVMPMLSNISQGYSTRLARSAQHVQTAGRLLVELAQIDMATCMSDDGMLDINPMRQLSSDRVDNLLRYWLSTLAVRMPSTARLAEMRSQLFDARPDAKVTIQHDQLGIHRYKNNIYAARIPLLEKALVIPVDFIWNGESSMYFAEFCGSLHFVQSNSGVDPSWLKNQQLNLRLREGGEKIKLSFDRPTRNIKSHFQTLKIPFWQRDRLPFLFVNKKLLYAAGVGAQSTFCTTGETEMMVNFNWVAD